MSGSSRRPSEKVVPWGEHRRLHWFGLTQGVVLPGGWWCRAAEIYRADHELDR
ncbi:DUF5984 family protein [Nocardia sp. NPDC005745]|uniref:DUF5984 family protein n=1 Tax=Nocardia sp. NPDC005745 TaxID=3157061 RepID=UPI0033F3A5E2